MSFQPGEGQYPAENRETSPYKMENVSARDEGDWAALIHISTLGGWLIPVPGMTVLGPLILWLVFRKESANLDAHGKEAVNFNITYLLFTVVLGIGGVILLFGSMFLFAALVGTSGPNSGPAAPVLGIASTVMVWILVGLLAIVVVAVHAVLSIIAAVKASRKELYRYPFTIRFLR